MSHINPDETTMLLIDHQSGLYQLVKDMPVPDLRRNAIALALAKTATLLKIPVITSASVPDGPNGPLIPEIHQVAPHAQYVGRNGEINVWDSLDFVKAVKATGHKTLIIAGTLTSVCMVFLLSVRWLTATRYMQLSMPQGTGAKWVQILRLLELRKRM